MTIAGNPRAGAKPSLRLDAGKTAALALPLMLGQAAQVLMHVIDSAMVGRLGLDSLAASAMGNNAVMPLFLIGVAIGSAVPALAARAFGAGDTAKMNLILRHGLTLSVIFATGSWALSAATVRWVLPCFGPASLVPVAQPYALLLLASLLPALLVQNLRGFVEAQSRPWLPLGNIVLGLALNVLFNFGLIYGHWGLPALGLPGAACGTLLARWIMFAHLAWILHRRPAIAPAAGWWRPVGARACRYGEYLRLALPTVAITVVFFGNAFVVAAWMGRLGPVAIAANEIARQVALLLFTLPLGFSFAIAIRVGQAAGANDHDRVRRVACSGVFVSTAAMAVAGAVLWCGRDLIPGWFLGAAAKAGDQAAVFSLTARLLTLAAGIVVANGLMLACIGVFRGLVSLRAAAILYVAGLWAIGLPLAHALGFAFARGAPGMWQGTLIACWLTAFSLAGLLWRALARSSGYPESRAAAVGGRRTA